MTAYSKNCVVKVAEDKDFKRQFFEKTSPNFKNCRSGISVTH